MFIICSFNWNYFYIIARHNDLIQFVHIEQFFLTFISHNVLLLNCYLQLILNLLEMGFIYQHVYTSFIALSWLINLWLIIFYNKLSY